jgi:hypothetical protein
MPSFLLASNTYTSLLPSFQEQLEALEKESKSRILVNTFNSLEPDALRAIEKFNLIGIGPLIPSVFWMEKIHPILLSEEIFSKAPRITTSNGSTLSPNHLLFTCRSGAYWC